ncbi:MAG: 6-phosphogluconolactonase [Acidobacteriota bacterium]|nr:6-phosphogluconolactonase [Acidobacteriota bacterium]
MTTSDVKGFSASNLKFEIHPSREAAGLAAARAAARSMSSLAARDPAVAVIFATGASQLAMLKALTSIPGLPWDRITGFHMDEYLDISADHPASFRRYLRDNLTRLVPMREFHEIDGAEANAEKTCAGYSSLLRASNPQLCLLGIGENGHLAFNDPAEANFWDSADAKVVALDRKCREQQVAEGWFPDIGAVPKQAITLTIPALLRVPKLIASVPGERKAAIVARVIKDPISTNCPATILKAHPDATVYLDEASGALVESLVRSGSETHA